MSAVKPRAVFFDWDGTAVYSRKAPADAALSAMKPLLAQGIKLVIVSGTTIENIAGGQMAKRSGRSDQRQKITYPEGE